MSFEPIPIVDAIKARHSVRVFRGPLVPARRAIVNQIIEEAQKLKTPFGTAAEIADHAPGLGKLGVISNEAGWIIAKIPADVEDNAKFVYDAGYRLHYCILRMTQQGFASVWITGTFNRSAAEASAPGFKVPGAVAYGEDGKKTGLVERFLKWCISGSTRKPLNELFFDGDNNRPFDETNAGDKLDLLQAVRSCCSALNVQSWRLFVTGNVLHLYYNAEREACRFDMGIALVTMKLFAEGTGKRLEFSFVDEPPVSPLGGVYVITCTIVE